MFKHKPLPFKQYKIHTLYSSFSLEAPYHTRKQAYTTIVSTTTPMETTFSTSHLKLSSYKTNLMQTLLLLTNLKKRQKDLFENRIFKYNTQQLTRLDDHKPLQQPILKSSSTVTGFKKLMYNFVKLNQNQLQPSYNRRKYSHSHYNQTLKECTRLNRTYAYLSKPTIKNYCAFTIKPTVNIHFLQNSIVPIKGLFFGLKPVKKGFLHKFFKLSTSLKTQYESLQNNFTFKQSTDLSAHNLIPNYNKARLVNSEIAYDRPIPKIVNFLESRLDVILWRNQFVSSIKGARQGLRQGVQVNGGLQKKASFLTQSGDVFAVID